MLETDSAGLFALSASEDPVALAELRRIFGDALFVELVDGLGKDDQARCDRLAALADELGVRTVVEVVRRWRVDVEWWKGDAATSRDHLTLRTADGTLCEVFGDRRKGGWFLQRIAD